MSQAVHLIPNVSGSRILDSRSLPCLGVSSSSIVSSCASHSDLIPNSKVKLIPLKSTSKKLSFTCQASSGGGHRRNPDFPRQNRHGFSRNKNRQNEERGGSYENLEESDLLSSKHGPSLSLSSTPKSSATSAPGPREKEIVELFRKVQAQLRERAAMKEERKIEAQQGQGKGGETVDSLLKLLRKHSVERSKRNSTSTSSHSNNSSVSFNRLEQNGSNDDVKKTGFSGSNSSLKDEVQEPSTNVSPVTRPVSNFQRKSPVPRVKYQPVYSDMVHLNANGRKVKIEAETMPQPMPEIELEPELEVEAELELDPIDEGYDDEKEEREGIIEQRDLSSMKLLELRALAKSQGIKGFSKMKKNELVELLSEAQV